MIYYHGSNQIFDKADPSISSRFSATQFTEGQGFYFTSSEKVALSYGPILYRVMIPDYRIGDFRNGEIIEQAVRMMLDSVQLPACLLAPADLETLKEDILNCDIAVSELPRQLALILENDPTLYSAVQRYHLDDTLADDFNTAFQARYPAYLFPFNAEPDVIYGKVSTDFSSLRIQRVFPEQQIL